MAKKYIAEEAAVEAIMKPKVLPDAEIFNALKKACQEEVKNLPAADVVEVRHGRWEWYDSFSYRCSACEKYWIAPGDQYDYRYCPSCGARMDGDGDV